MKVNNHIKTSPSRKVFVVTNTVLLVLLSCVFLFPYLNVLAKSLNDASDTALGGLTVFPRAFTLTNFKVVFADETLMSSFFVTVAYVVIGSAWALFVNYSAAYALLQKTLWAKKIFLAILTIPMFISGGLISNLLIYAKLKVYNTFFVYILPQAFSFFNMVVIRTYLSGISDSYREAARIDGASEITVMLKIYLPLSMPIVSTILLWTAVSYWNDWTTSLYYIRNSSLYTMQYVLQQSLKETNRIQTLIANAIANGLPIGNVDSSVSGDSIQSAQIIVTTLPILLVYPFLQKYFIKGVMIGGIKE